MTVGVAILGSTGSIGQSAIRVLQRHRNRFRVVALTAHANADRLAEQVALTGATFVGLSSDLVQGPTSWRVGPHCMSEAATLDEVDIVLNAVVELRGLDATLAALRAGKRVALANKESLVVGGELVLQAARDGGREIVPVDSEHSAIFQCLRGRRATDVSRLVLTASGGPLRHWTPAQLEAATTETMRCGTHLMPDGEGRSPLTAPPSPTRPWR